MHSLYIRILGPLNEGFNNPGYLNSVEGEYNEYIPHVFARLF
jgi:hypothetical protein